MRGCLGWLLLWPLVGALWLVGRISDAAAEHGGAWRFVGAGTNLGIGAGVALLGYYLAFRGFTTFDGYTERRTTLPPLGWIMIVGGVLMGLFGSITALTKQDRNQLTRGGRQGRREMDRYRKTFEEIRSILTRY